MDQLGGPLDRERCETGCLLFVPNPFPMLPFPARTPQACVETGLIGELINLNHAGPALSYVFTVCFSIYYGSRVVNKVE